MPLQFIQVYYAHPETIPGMSTKTKNTRTWIFLGQCFKNTNVIVYMPELIFCMFV